MLDRADKARVDLDKALIRIVRSIHRHILRFAHLEGSGADVQRVHHADNRLCAEGDISVDAVQLDVNRPFAFRQRAVGCHNARVVHREAFGQLRAVRQGDGRDVHVAEGNRQRLRGIAVEFEDTGFKADVAIVHRAAVGVVPQDFLRTAANRGVVGLGEERAFRAVADADTVAIRIPSADFQADVRQRRASAQHLIVALTHHQVQRAVCALPCVGFKDGAVRPFVANQLVHRKVQLAVDQTDAVEGAHHARRATDFTASAPRRPPCARSPFPADGSCRRRWSAGRTRRS